MKMNIIEYEKRLSEKSLLIKELEAELEMTNQGMILLAIELDELEQQRLGTQIDLIKQQQSEIIATKKHLLEISISATQDIAFQEHRAAELLVANRELALQNIQRRKESLELVMLNEELAFQNTQKANRSAELMIANQELIFQNSEKSARAAELILANDKLIFENAEKEKRAVELMIANRELAFQHLEKQKRAVELIMKNEELAFQNAKKEKLAAVLAIANQKLEFQKQQAIEHLEKEQRNAELLTARDANEVLHRQVNHMQKLESIGRLTSGIAHDFNNILACMLGYNEMNKDIGSDMLDDALKAELENNTRQVELAGKRATALIGKMLTYCRQDVKKEKMDVKPTKDVIEEVLSMLRPALTSRITIEFMDACPINNGACGEYENCDVDIQIDAIDLHQILTNLAVNARDAMKKRGGVILISLNMVTNVNAQCMACGAGLGGNFIELSVSDNGHGIDLEILNRIFDPFFTTKEQGEGTGLGLSTVSGMVHQSHGCILIDSKLTMPNQGTKFRLLFPIQPRNVSSLA